jgi:hypothetical protein
MDFTETKDEGLKDFIIVVIKSGDTIIYEKVLSEALLGESVVFDCDINANEPYVLDVQYKMPSDVGNEAMNTKTSFDIKFTIEMV